MKNKKEISVKVCGITREDNMLEIAKLRSQYMGFIFYSGSERDVSNNIKNIALNKLGDEIKKVAVMVNKPLDTTQGIITKYGFNMVQLHGNESPGYCEKIRSIVPVIKTFSVLDKLPENIAEYNDCCDYILFDTKTEKHGGSGIAFNHEILGDYNIPIPFFLSGGIAPEHSEHIKSLYHPMLFAIDINSRFESSPGIKDIKMLSTFIKDLRK